MKLAAVLLGACALLLGNGALAGATSIARTGSLPIGAVEDAGARTQFSSTFALPNGSRAVVVSALPLNFRDATGGWKAIDDRLRRDEDERIVNSAGKLRYDQYGQTTLDTGSAPTAYGYAGGELVADGFVRFGKRYYNPSLGRWTQPDPLEQPERVRDANPFAYAGNDPVNLTDPTGLQPSPCHTKRGKRQVYCNRRRTKNQTAQAIGLVCFAAGNPWNPVKLIVVAAWVSCGTYGLRP